MKSVRHRRQLLTCLCLLLTACAGQRAAGPDRAPIENRLHTPAATATMAAPSVRPAMPAATVSKAAPPAPAQLALTEKPVRAVPPPPSVAPLTPAVQSLVSAATQSAAQGNWDRAQAALERAVKLAPDKPALWTQLAYTHYRKGDFDRAREVAQRALVLSAAGGQEQTTLWNLIAEIEAARGNTSAAVAARAKATRLRP